ncbi:uncharacterized protein LOC123225328 [Mangifera indica]|uniref:uncharacterized protein LOC123225328 n=1 Tax=Mangifera indica TaxID=29780 RepID=UPI001CFAE47D|nr:uncharacterized protein LOC123225328 [Mangifera indica]XP_044505198.1 uncharacterized protein LOC123225328 [Mangifera indica]XP_044505199.1 uncharacterized protein LOC123225328 [Mangifera indica]
MTVSYKYWDDCVDPQDMEEMWEDGEVSTEWLDAGEEREQKVHLSRDPDGEPFLTQTELKAVVNITVRRHFDSEIDPDMICAICELESDRLLLSMRIEKKSKDTTQGLMQISTKTATWLFGEMGYRAYDVQTDPDLLYRPFVSIYFGAAYLKWLSTYDGIERGEEYIVRAYKGGTKKATHKSTLSYWKRYVAVKETLLSRKFLDDGPWRSNVSSTAPANKPPSGTDYWDARASPEDMEEMWNNPEVAKEWTKSGEKRGRVRFSHDAKKTPYLSRIELKAVAEIILSKYFSAKGVKPTVLCALAEMVSMRFVNGVGAKPGIMGIDYSTAFWIYVELGYRAYKVDSMEDLNKPFVSMYFGAAYLAWLSEYEGRERTPQFIVQAFLAGPKNVNLQETGPSWLKFEQTLASFEGTKRSQGSCTIL